MYLFFQEVSSGPSTDVDNDGKNSVGKCVREGRFPHPSGDCKKYIKCKASGSKPILEYCSDQTRYDPFSRQCAEKTEARSCKGW